MATALEKLFAPFTGTYAVTQPFGPTDYTAEPAYDGYTHFHDGIDYALPSGTPVLAAGAGTVIASGWDTTGFGNRIEIDMGNGIDTLYGHLSSLGVAVGQTVAAGEQIGLSGSTGNSSGPHLHFSVLSGGQFVDPTPYLTGGSPTPTTSGGGGNWWDAITGIPGDIGSAVSGAGQAAVKAENAAASNPLAALLDLFTGGAAAVPGSSVPGNATGTNPLLDPLLAGLGLPTSAEAGSFLKKWGLIILLSIGALLLVLELFRSEDH